MTVTEGVSPLAVALEHVPEDMTATQRLVAAYLFEAGRATVQEVTEATCVSRPTTRRSLKQLVEANLARETEVTTDARGRNPTVYVGTPPADGELETTTRELKKEIVLELARTHYLRRVSTATARDVCRNIGIDDARVLGPALGELQEDGLVENVKADVGTKNRYRLTAPARAAPFDAAEAEDVGGEA